LVEDYATGLLSQAELTQAKATVERQLDQVQEQLAFLQPQLALDLVPTGQTIREAWDKGSLAWRRMVLGLLIERIVIKPARPTYTQYHGYRFSPESVETIWKGIEPFFTKLQTAYADLHGPGREDGRVPRPPSLPSPR
jgi:site-specific DNA recombinase